MVNIKVQKIFPRCIWCMQACHNVTWTTPTLPFLNQPPPPPTKLFLSWFEQHGNHAKSWFFVDFVSNAHVEHIIKYFIKDLYPFELLGLMSFLLRIFLQISKVGCGGYKLVCEVCWRRTIWVRIPLGKVKLKAKNLYTGEIKLVFIWAWKGSWEDKCFHSLTRNHPNSFKQKNTDCFFSLISLIVAILQFGALSKLGHFRRLTGAQYLWERILLSRVKHTSLVASPNLKIAISFTYFVGCRANFLEFEARSSFPETERLLIIADLCSSEIQQKAKAWQLGLWSKKEAKRSKMVPRGIFSDLLWWTSYKCKLQLWPHS